LRIWQSLTWSRISQSWIGPKISHTVFMSIDPFSFTVRFKTILHPTYTSSRSTSSIHFPYRRAVYVTGPFCVS
jgi:hypothetical protein